MAHETDDRRCRIVPSGDLKCVWMSAGILAYQLCERSLDCEHCPLDQALRARFHRGDPDAAEPAAAPRPAVRLPDDRRYSRNHCWVRTENNAPGPSAYRVGLEPGLAAVLPMPHAAVLPRAGEAIEQARAHLWIVAEGGTFPLAAPLAGTVRRPNPRLAGQPSLVSTSPLDEGWLYELETRPPGSPVEALMDAATAEPGYAAAARRFGAELARTLDRHGRALGPTLADGGALLADVAQMLGPARYFEILCRVYA